MDPPRLLKQTQSIPQSATPPAARGRVGEHLHQQIVEGGGVQTLLRLCDSCRGADPSEDTGHPPAPSFAGVCSLLCATSPSNLLHYIYFSLLHIKPFHVYIFIYIFLFFSLLHIPSTPPFSFFIRRRTPPPDDIPPSSPSSCQPPLSLPPPGFPCGAGGAPIAVAVRASRAGPSLRPTAGGEGVQSGPVQQLMGLGTKQQSPRDALPPVDSRPRSIYFVSDCVLTLEPNISINSK